MLSAVFAFWAAYVLTRPLGASFGDWLSQSRDNGGLGLDTVGPSVVFLLASVALVAYLTRTGVDVSDDRPAAQRRRRSTHTPTGRRPGCGCCWSRTRSVWPRRSGTG